MATRKSAASRAAGLGKAVQLVTDRPILSKIAKTSQKIDELEFNEDSGVDTVSLAVAMLQNREMSKIVEWLTKATGEDEIACVVGTLIAASRNAARA